MPALVIMIRSKYTSSFLPTSIESENISKDSLHFSDLNKATRETMDNLEKLKIFFLYFKSNFLQKSKIK